MCASSFRRFARSAGSSTLKVTLLKKASLDPQDVGGPPDTGEQVLSLLGVEEAPERLDARDDNSQVVLAGQGDHSVDQVVAR